MKSNSIIQIVNNEPRISHKVIAKHTENKDVSIRKLIDKYIDKLEFFGVVSFEMTTVSEDKLKENPDLKPSKTYFLNEPQATLLLTFLRNNEIVVYFKVDLVRAFFEMRTQLQNIPLQKFEEISLSKIVEQTEKAVEVMKLLENRNAFELFQIDKIAGKFSPTKLLNIDFSQTYFLPTEIGKILGISGAEVNLILEKRGFQKRDENGVWRPTSSANDFCLEIGNKFHQLKWRISSII
ncbi:Phage regulatory protein Rha (Phage_pRha) [Thiovulum sp. ES]|nr:Phage regulatory protein Rha (Phage_pRha) [Thiovulum sp. ES]